MYNAINQAADDLLNDLEGSINAYDWLLEKLHASDVSLDENYQRRYRGFWRVRFPPKEYQTAYFACLEENKSNADLAPKTIVAELEAVSDRLEFSFATKLAHMVNPDLPIYDANVADFYFLPSAPPKSGYAAKAKHCLDGYGFLVEEYNRVIRLGLLDEAIHAFRERFPEAHHTDGKVIDWYIWQFITAARNGGFRERNLRHH